MRWKQELIGASLALAVTVIGGLVVYAVTQRPDAEHKERLAYQIDRSVSFNGKDKSLSIGSLRFSNSGDMAAREVLATVTSNDAKILEFTATRESGPNPIVVVKPDGHVATVSMPNLLPGDVVHATYLTDRAGRISFDLRSNSSIGKPRSILEQSTVPEGNRSRLNRVIEKLLPFLIPLSFVPLLLLRRLSKRFRYRGENRNNNAFVLMHTGHPQDAMDLLKASIDHGQDGSFAMANYAGAAALQGQVEIADKFIKAADFLAESPHEKAIVALNRSIIAYKASNKEEATRLMREAVELSRRELRDYFTHSLILQQMAEWEPQIRAILEEKKKS